jgi:hypothetical protein
MNITMRSRTETTFTLEIELDSEEELSLVERAKNENKNLGFYVKVMAEDEVGQYFNMLNNWEPDKK